MNNQNELAQNLDSNLLSKLGNEKIEDLKKSLVESFKRIGQKESVDESEVKLVIRYNENYLSQYLLKTLTLLGETHHGAVMQLALRFKQLETGDSDLYYQIFRDRLPSDVTKLPATYEQMLNSFFIANLPRLNKQNNVPKSDWPAIMVTMGIFGSNNSEIQMKVYQQQPDNKIKMMYSFIFEDKMVKLHPDAIYFEIYIKDAFLRRANFSKDFLGSETILDVTGREQLVRSTLAGASMEVFGEKIEIPGQIQKYSTKHNLSPGQIACVFVKEKDKQPTLSICSVLAGSTALNHLEFFEIF